MKIFENVAGLAAAHLKDGQIVETKGYTSPGDGGQARYLIQTAVQYTGTPDEFGDHTLANGNIAVLQRGTEANVKQFGALGDGATNDTAAINAARVYASDKGVPLLFPAGTYEHSGITITGSEHLRGAGKDETTLHLISGSNTHLIAYTGAADCSLCSMTLNSDRANQTGGHGIRIGGVDGLLVSDVHVQSPFSYGIGAQAGTNKNIRIHRLSSDDSGQDGIDIKDFDLDNENIVMSDVYISNFGQLVSQQAGVDIRGPVSITNLHVKSNVDDGQGLRLRSAGAQGREGSGVFSNIAYIGTGGNSGHALHISTGVRNYTVQNLSATTADLIVVTEADAGGIISNVTGKTIGQDAFSIAGAGCRISHVDVEDVVRLADFEAGATDNVISGFKVSGISGSEWARIQATCDANRLFDGEVTASKALNDAGTDTIVRDVKNWKTAEKLLSSDLLVDSTGSKTFILNHTLGAAPNVQDVQLSLIRSTGSPTDYRVRYLHLESVSSSDIAGRVFVDLASATGGAAIKVAAYIRIKGA